MKISLTINGKALLGMSRNKGIAEPPPSTLFSAIEYARQNWQQALNEMDHIDGSMVEYVVFKISAAEKRYVALLEQAKKEGLVAWPAPGSNGGKELPAANTASGVENEAIV